MAVPSNREDPLDRIAKLATIIAALVAIITLPYIVINMNVSIEQLKSSIIATENLSELIESNKNQTRALQDTIKEIQHQTVVNAYNSGGNFDVKITRCSFTEHTDQFDLHLGYSVSFKPVMVTENGVETTVPFRIFSDLEFKEKETRSGAPTNYIFNQIDVMPFVHNTANPSGGVEIMIDDVLEEAEQLGLKFVHVDIEYSFRPFSPAMNDNSFADQSEQKIQAIYLLKLHDNGKWHPEDFKEQYICRG